jgi:hypothetical protein
LEVQNSDLGKEQNIELQIGGLTVYIHTRDGANFGFCRVGASKESTVGLTIPVDHRKQGIFIHE